MGNNSDGTFTCDDCGKIFLQTNQTNEELDAECLDNFGCTSKNTQMTIVCDDCYAKYLDIRKAELN